MVNSKDVDNTASIWFPYSKQGTLACSESITTHQVWPLLALEMNNRMQASSVDADDIIYKQILACYAASVYVSAKPTSQANKIWCDSYAVRIS